MWTSKAHRGIVRCLLRDLSPIQESLETLTSSRRSLSSPSTRTPPLTSAFPNSRSFSIGAGESGLHFDRPHELERNRLDDESPNQTVLFEKDGAFDEEPVSISRDDGDSSDNLSSLWEDGEGVDESIAFGSFEVAEGEDAEVVEVNEEQVSSVVSLLGGPPLQESIESSLENMELSLSEEFVVRVLEAPDLLGNENLIEFYKWALRNSNSMRKSSKALDLLTRTLLYWPELQKKVVYMLWDLIRDVGKQKGLINLDIMNHLLHMLWKLEKGKAALEVFEKLPELGCVANGDSFYYTIDALGKRHMIDAAWSVCEKMLDSGSLPDGDKIGVIIVVLCKVKKIKEAHLVYLAAQKKHISLKARHCEKLISCLSRDSETLKIAVKLLEDYPKDSIKYANKAFASVVKGLCKAGNLPEAKKLLMRMVESGPAPGTAVFNFVITALSKGGEVGDAVALLAVIENRGLRPDIYAYIVIMSGFAAGGLMEEAHKVFSQAKKKHSKLVPDMYRILISGFCKMEEFQKALECLQEMKSDGFRPRSAEYEMVIRAFCLKGLNWKEAEKLLEEMKESGLYLKGSIRSLVSAVKDLEEEVRIGTERVSTQV